MSNSINIHDREIARKVSLLGNLIKTDDVDYDQIIARARAVRVPAQTILDWCRQYQASGADALIPEYTPSADKLDLAQERHAKIAPEADQEFITDADINNIAARNQWSHRTALRWVKRYRCAGLWGMIPGNDISGNKNHKPNKPPRNLGTLSEDELNTVFIRYRMIEPLLNLNTTTNQDFTDRADELRTEGLKTSARSLRDYARRYTDWGMAGLADRERSDKRESYKISKKMVEIIQGIRLSQKDIAVRAVHERAVEIAKKQGVSAPSEAQVRRIVNNIPEEVRLIADGRYDPFRNKFRMTFPIGFGNRVVYQLDHTPIDVLARDIRPEKIRNRSGEIRPWLTTVIESRSRRLLAWIIGYDRPDRFTVGMAIRQALITGGVPDELWVDQGREIISQYVREISRSAKFELIILDKHQPQQKGRVERFFGTLNTRLWCDIPGYVGSNVQERNPTAKAYYTPAELEEKLTEFIENVYHQEIHSETGRTPLEFFSSDIFTQAPDDPRMLDILLSEPERRRVIKQGIKYRKHIYWHADLGSIVGQDVIIRSQRPYGPPQNIEVYYRGNWVCTAVDIESESGQTINRKEIANAQRAQKSAIRGKINLARQTLADVEQELKEQRNEKIISRNAPQQKEKQQKSKEQSKKTPKKRGNLWERIDDK